MKWMDKWFERRSRDIAQQASRRSALVSVGKILVGAAFVLPVLPYDRSNRALAASLNNKHEPTETDCDYWRYCAVDGYLCACCGGTMTSCPPGTEPSKVAWVGTCRNPKDGKDYLVSYNDCCGKTTCGRCQCSTAERERPGYRMGVHNDVNWCMANDSSMFHCTTSVVVGVAE